MSSINDVAKRAQVSKSTVSYVFSKKKYVSPVIVERVMQACKELNYKPNFFAANVISNNSGIVGLFFEPDNSNWYGFYDDLIRVCVVELDKRGMKLIPYFNLTKGVLADLLHNGRAPIMGAIIVTPQVLDERIMQFGQDHLPYVLIGQPNESLPNLHNVDVNNKALSREIFEYIYSMGHRKILFINAEEHKTISKHRESALKDFVADKPDLEVTVRHAPDSAGKAAKVFESEGGAYTCVAVASDIMAADIYASCQAKGLTVGSDLSVIAFGGSGDNSLVPKLTCARQNYSKMAYAAVKMLGDLLQDGPLPHSKTFLVRSELILGDSVGKV